jgi:hypothetical protein
MIGIEHDDELIAKRAARLKIVKARDGRKGIEVEIGFDFSTMDFNERTMFQGRDVAPIVGAARHAGLHVLSPTPIAAFQAAAPPALLVPTTSGFVPYGTEPTSNGHAVTPIENPFLVVDNPFLAA